MVRGVCLQCQGERLVHKGAAVGKPHKRCKQCGDPCTRTTPRGKPLATKITAVLWYVSGLSMHRVAFLLRVSTPAVLTWIRDVATASDEKPATTGRIIVLQRDEMWHSLKHKRGKLWRGKALDRDTGQLLEGECGRRDQQTLQKRVVRLAPWDVTMSCTDKRAPSASVIPQDTLVQSQATTQAIERSHWRQRHWFGRCKRTSIIVSQSKEMVELIMALFTKLWVNGNQDALLSRLA